MNRLTPERRAAVIRCLVEGNSIRATVRMTGAAKNTVAKLLVELGYACSEYQDRVLRELNCKRVQCDEIWSFVGCKEKNVPEEKRGTGECGDAWTWTAIDADTKLVISWYVGDRSGATAATFMSDVAARLKHRVQLTTDGHNSYLVAVEEAFGGAVDYAMLVKVYGNDPVAEKRYSPAVCMAAYGTPITGTPDPKHISTSYVERQNLTMRMSMRRFTRLTNAFSKKVENHTCAIALHFMYYNFARPHKTLSDPYPRTPAMAAGVTDHVWPVEEIVDLIAN
jgi:IS1 family transposase